jgi:preprotein translocase subunit SecG
MSILLNVLLVFYVIVTVLMILIILMQRPKSEGLGAAFGGGVTDNIFGAQTSNVLTKITGWLAGTFFFMTFALSVVYAHRSGGSGALRQELMKTAPTAPVTATSPAPGTPAAPVDGQQAVAAPAGDQVPPAAVQASSPTGADMAAGAVEPVPPPGNTVAPNASTSPGGKP